MPKIPKGPPSGGKLPGDVQAPADSKGPKKAEQQAAQNTQAKSSSKPQDRFEAAAERVQKNLGGKLQPLAEKMGGGKLKISPQEMAQIVAAFGLMLADEPQATRRRRARLFAEAVMRRKKLKKLFAKIPKRDRDNMFDAIAEQIDEAPVFAELVEQVTEGMESYAG